MSSTSTTDADGKHHVDAKTQRFDRQIRLWGKHGQIALENAHVCCLGAGATASEILKNLVLPSVGKITLIDDTKVAPVDTGNNFFVRRTCVGQNRAAVVGKYLNELNPDVTITPDERAPADVVESDIKFFSKFDIVVSTILDQTPARALAKALYPQGIAFVNVKVNGLLGHIRLATPEVAVAETHFEYDRSDLYIHPDQTSKWPEYKAWLESFEMGPMTNAQHKHVPHVAILHKQIGIWCAEHGSVPKKFKEKKEFKAQIKAASRSFYAEENFMEAVANAARTYNFPSLDPLVQEVFDDEKAKTLVDPTLFWICVRATNDWKANEGNGRLPVSNAIPDMASDTKSYVALKDIFYAQAAIDLKQISARAEALCTEHGTQFDAEEVERFIKNVRFVGLARTTDYEHEFSAETFPAAAVNEVFEDYYEFDKSKRPIDMHWYFCFRAGEAFKESEGRYPGSDDSTLAADTEAIATLGQALATEYGVTTPIERRCFEEYVRYGNSEIHNTAALIGGIVSQIALKVLIKQFIPISNTLIVNGINMSVGTYTL